MKPGPPPQPGSVRSRKRAEQQADATPSPPTAPPAAPEYLSETGREVWVETVRRLSALHLLDGADLNLVEAYSEAVARHRAASEELAAAGCVGRSDRGGQSVHPAARVQQQAAEAMRKLAIELGLTLSGRLKLGKQEQEHEVSPLRLFQDQPRRFRLLMRFPELEEQKEWIYKLSPDDYTRFAEEHERKIAESKPKGPRPLKPGA